MNINNRFKAWLMIDNKYYNYFIIGLIVSFILRIILINNYLPYYSIDENEVVESALGFVVGDLDPRFYKYGFLTSYILAVIYKLYSIILSTFSTNYSSSDQVLYGVFFDKYAFYYIARLVQSIYHIVIAVFIFRISILFFNKRIAFLTALFLFFPIQEFHLAYTVRVDATLALSFVLTSYFYLQYINTDKTKYLNGIIIGLALAFSSKPMPALFGFIVLLVPFVRSKIKPQFIVKSSLIFIGVSLVVNPYFILNFKEFYMYNYNSLMGFQTSSEEMSRYAFGYEFYWLIKYGYIFKYLAIASMGYILFYMIKERSKESNLIHFLLIPFAYIFCFSIFNTRYYWFVIVLPYLFFILAFLFEKYIYHRSFSINFKYLLFVILLTISLYKVIDSNLLILNRVLTKTSASELIEKRVKEIVPKNSNVLIIGDQSRGPQLYSNNIQTTASRGQYFMYERIRNKGYVDFFRKAFDYYNKNKIMYNLFVPFGNNSYSDLKSPEQRNFIEKQFMRYLKVNKIQYVVLMSSFKETVEAWESSENVEMVINSSDYKDIFGYPVKLLKIN